MRVFLLGVAASLFPVANSIADSGYRLLHFDKSFRDQKCISANPPTALCVVETEATCRSYREPTLCESINHPHYGWFSRRTDRRSFFKVRENRAVTKKDISRFRKHEFKRTILNSDTYIRIDHGGCAPDRECMKRVKEYNQDLPEETGCVGWFDCHLSRTDDYIFVVRKVRGKWTIILRAVLPSKYSDTYNVEQVNPLQETR